MYAQDFSSFEHVKMGSCSISYVYKAVVSQAFVFPDQQMPDMRNKLRGLCMIEAMHLSRFLFRFYLLPISTALDAKKSINEQR